MPALLRSFVPSLLFYRPVRFERASFGCPVRGALCPAEEPGLFWRVDEAPGAGRLFCAGAAC